MPTQLTLWKKQMVQHILKTMLRWTSVNIYPFISGIDRTSFPHVVLDRKSS